MTELAGVCVYFFIEQFLQKVKFPSDFIPNKDVSNAEVSVTAGKEKQETSKETQTQTEENTELKTAETLFF